MKKRIVYATVVALMLFPATIMAAEAEEKEMRTMEEVVVTATRVSKDIKKVPANVIVITADEISDSGASNIVEVLVKKANINFVSTSGNVTEAKIDLRGFGSETGYGRTLVLLDGRRLNRPDMSSISWAQLPLEQIERIEVVRGSGSVLYGDAAVAGVIHIITKKGGMEPSINGSLQIGEDKFHNESAGIIGSSDRLSYSVNASNQKTDGWRDRTGYHSYGGGFQLGYDISDSLSISGGASYNDTYYELAGSLNSLELAQDRTQSNNLDHEADIELFNSNLLIEGSLGNRGDIEINLVYGTSLNTSTRPSWFSFLDSDIESIGIQPKYILSTNHGSLNNQFITGVDIYYENLTAENYNEAGRINLNNLTEIDKDTVGWYMRDEVSLGDNFIFSGGIRVERSKVHVNYRDYAVTADSFDDEKEHDGEVFELSAIWLPKEDLKFFSRFSKVYRYPFVDEQASYAGFLPKGFESGLDAEKGKNIEAGFEINLSESFGAGINLYQIDMEDEIVLNQDGWPWFNQNSEDDTRHRGFETHIDYTIKDFIELRVLYTYQESTFETGQNSGNDIPLVPNQILSTNLDLSLPHNINFIPSLRYVGDSYASGDNGNINEKLDDYTIVDLLIRYKKHTKKSQITIFLGINNLFDKEYSPYGSTQYDYFYPAPGRKFYGGISGTF